MGLDIYHLHVRDEVTDNRVKIDATQPQLQKIVPFSRKVTNQYIDFARLLVEHGYSPQDYRLGFHQHEMWGIGKSADNYYFIAADDPDPMNPTKTALYFTDKKSFFPTKPQLPPNALKKTKRHKLKAYPMREQQDDVVYVTQAGYQRKNVFDQFFAEFPPDFIFAERSYADQLLELTVPEARNEYRANFLDNWDPQRSMVVISW
jgi:hypothetical protein